MKRAIIILVLAVWAGTSFSQEDKPNCRDILVLKDGSVFRGKIISYSPETEIIMSTWSGMELRLPSQNIRKIKQRCRGERSVSDIFQRPYSFREKGWYHATRGYGLTGADGVGMGLQHSSGIKLNRFLGFGLGVGYDNYNERIGTYPVFAELRGYLLKKNISPFYAVGGGYGFSGQGNNDQIIFDGPSEHWEGGWLAQGQIGCRIGNHLIAHIGLHFQHKTRTWTSPWQPGFEGRDQLLYKRLEFGIGILL